MINNLVMIEDKMLIGVTPIDIPILQETNNIMAKVDYVMENNIIDITGWAFIKGKNARNCQVYLILKTENNQAFIYKTYLDKAFDVTAQNKNILKIKLDNTGFRCKLDRRNLTANRYIVALLIKSDFLQACQNTETIIYNSPT